MDERFLWWNARFLFAYIAMMWLGPNFGIALAIAYIGYLKDNNGR